MIRYVIAGAASYLIELSCLAMLHYSLGLSAVTSTAIAFWVGLATAFIFQKLLVFQDYERELKAISKQLGFYTGLVAFNYIVTLGIVHVFPGSWVLATRTFALIVTTTWNFFLYGRLFNNKV